MILKLDGTLTIDQATVEAKNLTDRFSEDDLKRLGEWVVAGYERDKQSRQKWETRTASAMDLAMQIQKAKTFPWPDCSNVAFPLVTIAVLQFHARAYSQIVDGQSVVKYRVVGDDPDGSKTARASRVGSHMSWQLLEQDRDWEPQHDRLLINLATVGCAFKKSYYQGSQRMNQSDLVMAKDLVLDYWSTSVGESPRKTHIIPMYRNELYERCKRGLFRDICDAPWFGAPAIVPQNTQQIQSDKRQGVNPTSPPDENTPFQMLEQHCIADLDGDGYAEPYIITVEHTNKCVVRIVTRFDSMEDIEKTESGEIICIKAKEYFTKYTFLPSPDGGIYDIGFGVLLGPLNESTNSLINQLIDAGTMSVTAGGFLGRGAKLRGGDYRFAPLEWKRVDGTGEDLSKSIFPLPVREPNAVLFNLLSLLVNYTQRVSGNTDMMVGESPGQNTPAETARTVAQEGSRIYNSIFKRIWWSMKEEFEKLYILNSIHLPYQFEFPGVGGMVTKADYEGSPVDIVPVADPNITSDVMKFQQAQAVKASAMQTPGYDHDEVEKFYLSSLRVPSIDVMFPGTKKLPPGPSEKIQIEQMRTQVEMAKLQQQKMEFVAEMMEEQKLNEAKILEIKGNLMIAAQSAETDKGDQQVGMMNAMVGMFEARNKVLEARIKHAIEQVKLQNAAMDASAERMRLTHEARQAHHQRILDHRQQALDHTQQGLDLLGHINDAKGHANDARQVEVDKKALEQEATQGAE